VIRDDGVTERGFRSSFRDEAGEQTDTSGEVLRPALQIATLRSLPE
jgi:hypothetical protein